MCVISVNYSVDGQTLKCSGFIVAQALVLFRVIVSTKHLSKMHFKRVYYFKHYFLFASSLEHIPITAVEKKTKNAQINCGDLPLTFYLCISIQFFHVICTLTEVLVTVIISPDHVK